MRYLAPFVAFLALFGHHAQENCDNTLFNYGQTINDYNAKGQKEGLWILESESLTSFGWFLNGEKEGLHFAWYHDSNTIDQIELFHQDSPTLYLGIDELGRILSVMVCGINNEFSIMNVDGSLYMPWYKSYCKTFFPDGRLASEGFLVWNIGDEIVMGNQVKCGVWRYYDQTGRMTTEEYPHGNWRVNSPEKRVEFNNNSIVSGFNRSRPKRYDSGGGVIQNSEKLYRESYDFGQVINRFDSLGHKEGLWIENKDDYVLYGWFSEGRKNGISFSLRVSTNTLSWFDYYVNGDLKAFIRLCDGGDNHQSYPPGSVHSIYIGGINKEFFIEKQDGSLLKPYYKAYTKFFYPNRQIKSEGFLVWDKGESLVEESKACGKWIHFDREGRKTVKFYPEDRE